MKKLTAVLIAIGFAFTSFSQGHFRVQAGPTLSYLHSKGNVGSFSTVQAGFTAGLACEMVVAKHFSVQPEFNYVHLNATETVSSSKIKFDYIQIPVLLKLVNGGRNFSFYLGPQLGFLTKASSRSAGKTTDIKDNLTQTDFSGVVGIEYALKQNLLLNARFTQGFSNVYKAEFDSENTTRHEIIALTIGYAFNTTK